MNKLIVILTALFGAGAIYWFWKQNQPVYADSGDLLMTQDQCEGEHNGNWANGYWDDLPGYGYCYGKSGGSISYALRRQD